MPVHIHAPKRITAVGNKPKTIDEYVGRVNSETEQISIAHMKNPSGWEEAGQRPEFDEYTLVLKGMLRVTHRDGEFDVNAGEAIIARRGEWVRFGRAEHEAGLSLARLRICFTCMGRTWTESGFDHGLLFFLNGVSRR